MAQMQEEPLKPRAEALYSRLRRSAEALLLLRDPHGCSAIVAGALSHMILFVLLFQMIRAIRTFT